MKEIIVPANIEHMEEILEFINQELENVDCPMKTQMKIDITLDEIFTNIASYAYLSDSGKVTVRIKIEGNPLFAEIQFLDSGVPYNPLETDAPDITLSAEERDIGGLGIFIAKKSMDSMDYHYEDGQNVLTIKKFLI